MIRTGYIIQCRETKKYWSEQDGCYYNKMRDAEVFWSFKEAWSIRYHTNDIIELEIDFKVKITNRFKVFNKKEGLLEICKLERVSEPIC